MLIGNTILVPLAADTRIALGNEPVVAVRVRSLGGEQSLTLDRLPGEEVSDLFARAIDELEFAVARQAARAADARRLMEVRARSHSVS